VLLTAHLMLRRVAFYAGKSLLAMTGIVANSTSSVGALSCEFLLRLCFLSVYPRILSFCLLTDQISCSDECLVIEF
jgi:hypothetical protein